MNHLPPYFQRYPILFFFFFINSCNAQDSTNQSHNAPVQSLKKDTQEIPQAFTAPYLGLNNDAQMMLVLRRVFQDKSENLWFVGDDVFCYDGDTLRKISDHEIFSKTTIRQIAEDGEGNIWFGTSEGLIKYAPSPERPIRAESFSKYTEKDGLIYNDIWSLAIDQKGTIWVGTLEGLSQFDGTAFTPFSLPESEIDPLRGISGTKFVHSIMEDSKGKMWFGTNGGAYIYDGKTLSNISEKDGLCNNSVNDILEDKQGNIWFATHHNGVCRWDGSSFSLINEEQELKGTEVWSLYEDKSGNIWFPVENAGVYCYNGESLSNFHKKNGFPMNGVHSIMEDKTGQLWLGGFGGLYRYDGTSFTKVTKDGPWLN